jgi:hypothetical protein
LFFFIALLQRSEAKKATTATYRRLFLFLLLRCSEEGDGSNVVAFLLCFFCLLRCNTVKKATATAVVAFFSFFFLFLAEVLPLILLPYNEAKATNKVMGIVVVLSFGFAALQCNK